MKRPVLIMAALVVVVIAVLTLLSLRQQPLTYNTAKESTVTGTVTEVQESYCPLIDDRDMHMVVKTDNGDKMIHVALTRFLRRQNIAFSTGDKVDVLGSQVKPDTVIARQITRGHDTFMLRDAQGNPLWK